MGVVSVPHFYFLQIPVVSAAAWWRGHRSTALLICHPRSAGLIHAAGTPRPSLTPWFTCISKLVNSHQLCPRAPQAEFGDYEPDQPRPLDHISQWKFAPNQNKEMEEKILELHKSHRSDIRIELLVMMSLYYFRYFELYFSLYLGGCHQRRPTPIF